MLALPADGCLRRSWINIFAAATPRTCPWGQAGGRREGGYNVVNKFHVRAVFSSF